MIAIKGKAQTKSSRQKEKNYSMKCVQDKCIIEYKGKIKDRKFFKFVPFINTFGGTAVKVTEYLDFIVGFILIYICFLCAKYNHLFIALLSSFASIGSFHVGEFLSSNIEYLKATKCKKCSREYAYEETKEPDIKEVDTEYSYTVTITRYWKCKYCGYISSSESPENVKACKGKLEEPKQIKCERCGLVRIAPECRYPSTKVEKLPEKTITTTIRYYRCEYCRYVNIEVEKEIVRHGDPPGFSKSTGDDPRL